jgi:hypothetical protein
MLYLHIGLSKTGSSALQFFFQKNARVLKEHGITYPAHTFDNNRVSPGNGVDVAVLLRDGRDEEARENFQQLQSSEHKHLLLSSELFGFYLREDRIKHLAELVGPAKIVVYLRRQDEVIISKYNQRVKRFGYVVPFDEWIADILSDPGQLHDLFFDRLLAEWGRAFGDANLIVRPYESAQWHGEIIFSDFLHHCFGIEMDEAFVLPHGYINVSYCDDALEFKRLANCLKMADSILDNALQAYSDRHCSNSCRRTIRPDQRRALLTRFAEVNSYVAQRYVGQSDGKLFYSPLPSSDDYWHEYAGSTKRGICVIGDFIRAHDGPAFEKLRTEIEKSLHSGSGNILEAAEKLAAVLQKE